MKTKLWAAHKDGPSYWQVSMSKAYVVSRNDTSLVTISRYHNNEVVIFKYTVCLGGFRHGGTFWQVYVTSTLNQGVVDNIGPEFPSPVDAWNFLLRELGIR